MRPALKAGLRWLRRDQDTVQIGVDPRRAVALAGLGRAAAVLSLLDGSRDVDEVLRAAAEQGIPPRATRVVLGLLRGARVLDDYPLDLHRSLPGPLRARLAPDLACASLACRDDQGGAAVFGRRRSAAVRVYGGGRIGASVATLLAASGAFRVTCRDPGVTGYADLAPGGLGYEDIGVSRASSVARAISRAAPETKRAEDGVRAPDLAVLAGPADPQEVAALVRAGVPHLSAVADEAIGVVGPLVIPGRSACLRCGDLVRAERDPAWPMILAQSSGDIIPPACDTVLAAATAALAAAQALAFIDAGGRSAARGLSTVNGTLELVLPDWQWHRRTWLPHPGCTCGATGERGPRECRAAAG
jgi:hypothetical protein